MSDLAEFLLARIAEDEADARGFDGGYCQWGSARVLAECEAKRRIVEWCSERNRIWAGTLADDPTDPTKHIPGDYVHKEDAPVLRLLALPYADHPDYRQEWRTAAQVA